MTALELYQYIQENNIDWAYRYNPESKQDDVMVWINPCEIEFFVEMFAGNTPEYGFEMTFINGNFAFFMSDICDYYEIDMKQVFKQNQ
jgi:hypothetical protein